MKYLLKLLFLIYIIVLFAINGEVPYIAVLVLILITGVNVFKEKFIDTVYMMGIKLLCTC